MGKQNKTLPEVMRQVIELHGQDVVKDIRLSNILNDIKAFNELPPAKNVLRFVLKDGYGEMMLATNNKRSMLELLVKKGTTEMSQKYGYADGLVEYLFRSIIYGLRWTDFMPVYNPTSTMQNSTDLHYDDSSITQLKKSKKLVVYIAAFWAIVLSFLGISLNSSSERDELFSHSMAMGDSLLSSGEYLKAQTLFEQAALDGRELNTGQKEQLMLKSEEVKETIKNKVDNGRNTLLLNISANAGHLDADGEKLLDELLKLSPDDYWLNFIKRKINE